MTGHQSGLDHIACRPMTREDLESVLGIHLAAFEGFFLSILGPRFLREFYRATIDDPTSVTLTAQDLDRNVVGFIAGHLRPHGFYKRLVMRRWWAFSLAAIVPLLKDPHILPRLLRAVTYRGHAKAEDGGALLASVAVAPNCQTKGVGRLLVACFVKECQMRGAHYVYLTTDRDQNESVNRFYRRLGWTCRGQFRTPEGRWLNLYRMDWEYEFCRDSEGDPQCREAT